MLVLSQEKAEAKGREHGRHMDLSQWDTDFPEEIASQQTARAVRAGMGFRYATTYKSALLDEIESRI